MNEGRRPRVELTELQDEESGEVGHLGVVDEEREEAREWSERVHRELDRLCVELQVAAYRYTTLRSELNTRPHQRRVKITLIGVSAVP